MKRQRLILRTLTSERILISQTIKGPRPWESSAGQIGKSLPDGEYRLEIHKIEADGTQIIFECAFTGPVEFFEP